MIKNFIGNIPLVLGHSLIKLGDYFILYGVDLHIKFNTDAGKQFLRIKKMAQVLSMQISAPAEVKENAKPALKTGIVYAPKSDKN